MCILLLCVSLFHSILNAHNIAITIDDYPLTPGPLFTVAQRTQKFIEAAHAFNCPIAFFCVGNYYEQRGDQELFNLLYTHGHFIANHSTTHPVNSRLNPDEFHNEVITAEKTFDIHPHYKKWFRYPGLDYGNQKTRGGSTEKQIAFMNILKKLGYTDGYVTIDSYDWYINRKLTKALQEGKIVNYEKLKVFYVSLVEDRIRFYIDTYKRIFNEDITHTLLLHDNDLTVLYLSDILTMIHNNGWNLISPECAFTNPEWRKKITLFFSHNIPWISFVQVGQMFDAAGIVE